jgi:hypothetical protein
MKKVFPAALLLASIQAWGTPPTRYRYFEIKCAGPDYVYGKNPVKYIFDIGVDPYVKNEKFEIFMSSSIKIESLSKTSVEARFPLRKMVRIDITCKFLDDSAKFLALQCEGHVKKSPESNFLIFVINGDSTYYMKELDDQTCPRLEVKEDFTPYTFIKNPPEIKHNK